MQESGGLVVGWTWLAILGGLIGKGLELIVIFTLNKVFLVKILLNVTLRNLDKFITMLNCNRFQLHY